MNKSWYSVVVVVSVLCCYILGGNSKQCVPRKYKEDSVICVCNSSYCDTTPHLDTPSKGKFLLITSSRDGLRFSVTNGSFYSKEHTQESVFLVDRNITYQSIFGFGGAFTDSAGINILSLSKPTQNYLLRSYFSTDDGIGYTYGRVPIAGTDFSTHGYTYVDKDEDATLKNFSLTEEDYIYKIPIIKRAETFSKRQLKLVATSWSAPTWMKTNHAYNGYGVLKDEYYRAYANYHIKFLDKYREEGINFWCITTGNEPLNGLFIFNRLNALGWIPVSQKIWIGDHLGPMLNSSQHSDTCILAIDDQRIVLPWWLSEIMWYDPAKKYIDGIAVHWYLDFLIPSEVLSRTHKKFPDLFLINTESSYGDKPWDFVKVELGSWTRADSYGHHIIEDFNNWITGWIDWNLALNEQGGPNWVKNYVDSPIIVNKTSDEFYKQPIFYVLGHFSKFIPPGSFRIHNSGNPMFLVDVLTVKRPDNSVAIVFLNRRWKDIKFRLFDRERGSTVVQLPKHSISTMIYA